MNSFYHGDRSGACTIQRLFIQGNLNVYRIDSIFFSYIDIEILILTVYIDRKLILIAEKNNKNNKFLNGRPKSEKVKKSRS